MDSGSIERGADVGDGVAVVYLKGEHDLHTAQDVHDQLVGALEGAPGVIADLSNTTFVDSSIVGVLLDVRQSATGTGRLFAVCLSKDANDSVRRIFDITGLTESLPVLPNHDQALEATNRLHNGD